MDWQGHQQSPNVEIDCLGVRTSIDNAAAWEFLTEVHDLRNSVKGTPDEPVVGALLSLMQSNRERRKKWRVDKLDTPEESLAVVRAISSALDRDKQAPPNQSILGFLDFDSPYLGSTDKARANSLLRIARKQLK